MSEHAVRLTLNTAGRVSPLREGMRGYLKNPFTPEEEIVFGDPPEPAPGGRTLRIKAIDVENRTVTFE